MDFDLLTRYLSGTCTPLERGRVDRWLDNAPERTKFVQAVHEVAVDTRSLTAERKSAMLMRVKRQPATARPEIPVVASAEYQHGARNSRGFTLARLSRLSAVRVAAALALLGAAVAGHVALQSNKQVVPRTAVNGLRSFATAPGQRLAFRLPDGTAVSLAPASVLRLSPDYGTRERVVALEGEAVFTVTHDAERPFVVHTFHGIAHDLGTRFSLRAYPDDPAADVVVAEGVVSVIPNGSVVPRGDSVVLMPGERARIIVGEQLVIDRDVPLEPYFSWTTGRLVFRDMPLREAATRLSRWYDIDVRIASPAIGEVSLTAVLDEDTTVDILSLIAASLKLDLIQSGRMYTFAAK